MESGLGFGFALGLFQMMAWVVQPRPWTLPVAGALVGCESNETHLTDLYILALVLIKLFLCVFVKISQIG